MSSRRCLMVGAVILLVAAIALGLRLRAVRLLPIDYDEDGYLGAAQRYAQFIAAGDVRGIVDYAYLYEHPPLVKWVDALAILPLPPAALLPERPSTDPPVSKLPQPHIRVVRTVSAAFGTLEVVALAILDPFGGTVPRGAHLDDQVYQPDHARTAAVAVEFAGRHVLHQSETAWSPQGTIFRPLARLIRYRPRPDSGVKVHLRHRGGCDYGS